MFFEEPSVTTAEPRNPLYLLLLLASLLFVVTALAYAVVPTLEQKAATPASRRRPRSSATPCARTAGAGCSTRSAPSSSSASPAWPSIAYGPCKNSVAA